MIGQTMEERTTSATISTLAAMATEFGKSGMFVYLEQRYVASATTTSNCGIKNNGIRETTIPLPAITTQFMRLAVIFCQRKTARYIHVLSARLRSMPGRKLMALKIIRSEEQPSDLQ